jgi:hypothetical protein
VTSVRGCDLALATACGVPVRYDEGVSVTRKTVCAGRISDRVALGPLTLGVAGAAAPGLDPASEELTS